MVGRTAPSQAWSILSRHARDDITPLRLKDLCSDNDRTTSLVAVHSLNSNARSRIMESCSNSSMNGSRNDGNADLGINSLPNRILIADVSRQRITLETLNYLLR